MTYAIRIAAHMQPARDENGALFFKAALPMGALLDKSLDKTELESARVALQEKYRALVQELRALRAHLRDGNVLRYWMFGDAIVAFETETADALVFVDNLSAQLARDVDYSKTMIDLCRRFRYKFPDESALDPQISFRAYHRNGFDSERADAFEHAQKTSSRAHPRKT